VSPGPLLLAEMVDRHATNQGVANAILDGPGRSSWVALDRRADTVASSLLGARVRSGETVALLAPAGAPAITFIHGAARAGIVAVPLNERLTDAELHAFVRETGCVAVAATASTAGRAAHLGARVVSIESLALGDGGPLRRVTSPEVEAPAVIVATSGTTGRAKGAVLTHAQLAASATAWNAFLPPTTGWLASLSLAHVGGLGIIWRAALAGVPIVVAQPGESLEAALATPIVSHASLVAVQLARLLDSGVAAPPNLKAVLLGGGPIPAQLVSRALKAGWPVVPTYGMTESASGLTALATADAGSRPGSAGRALPQVQLRVANAAADGVGDIEVRGPSVFSGYSNRPEETAAAFTADGFYRTGDLGSVDADGYLTVADRRVDLIVSGGENVYPAEVEAVLMSHPAVAEAGVAGRPDASWGAVPVAAVVLRHGAVVADADLIEHCRPLLAKFKVPVAIVRLPELPRVGEGKVDRKALREALAAAPAADATPAADAEPSAAATPSGPAMPPAKYLDRPDGFRLAYRIIDGPDAAPWDPEPGKVLMLHATLSAGWQLKQLGRLLAESAMVVLPDRRGSGASKLPIPRPVTLAEHVADAVALLDELSLDKVTVMGHSYGAVVALALAAAHPDRVLQVVAYEPPLLEVVPPARGHPRDEIAALVVAAHASGGAAAAADVFLKAIGGGGMLEGASPAVRAALLAEGDGVLADVGAMDGATVDLARVECPAILVTGDASESFYAPIADAAAARMPAAERVRLPHLRHNAPISQPMPIADLLRHLLESNAD
jgi:O-succinylbenzoic acid--CoA ligase